MNVEDRSRNIGVSQAMFNSTDIDQEVYDKIYQRIYKEAEPGMDYSEAEKMEHGVPHYELHYLDDERTTEIIEEVCEEENVKERYRETVHSSVMLGAAPNGMKEVVNHNREKIGLEPIEEAKEEVEN